MLASDFIYDQSTALVGFSSRLSANATTIRLLNTSDNSVLHSLPLADFTGNVDIKGSPQNDTLIFDPSLNSLSTVLKSVKFDGNLRDDAATIEGDLETRGVVSLTAETILVFAGGSISTRALNAGASIANSSDITLMGKTVTLQTGSALLAGVTAGSAFAPGNITITVEDKPSAGESLIGDILSPILVTNRVASVSATGAEIDGGNVKINANSATQTRWDDVGEYFDDIADQLLTTLSSIADVAISLVSPISGQVKIQKATGDIKLTDSKITAGGKVEIAADSKSDASFTTVGINSRVPIGGSPLPFLISIGYGETLAKANVELAGTTSIVSGGDVKVTSNVESESSVVSRGTANGRLSGSDNVDFGVSLGISLTNEESTVKLGPNSRIESTAGSVNVKAKGEADTEAEAEAILFQDGIAGLAVGVSVDKATITSDVLGTIIAANPLGTAGFVFDAAMVVSVSDNSITLANIAFDKAIQRGQELTYRSGVNAPIGGLVDGESYVVADVENVPAGIIFTGTQKVRLAQSLPLELDVMQVNPLAMHTLAQLVLTEFPSTAVAFDNLGNLTMDLPGLVSGNKVEYLGPNSPVSEDNITARFQRDAAGDRITRTDGGKDWKALGLHVGQTFELSNALGTKIALSIKGFSSDGDTLILNQINLVIEGVFSTLSIKTTPDAPIGIGNLEQGTEYEVVIQSGKVLLKDPADPTKFIKFLNQGSGIHGFSRKINTKTFSPKTAVDGLRDAINLPAHGFQTGDLLVYRTDPTKTFDRTVSAFSSANTNTPTTLGTAKLPDAPIDGMETGFFYFVTRVDGDHIRLSEGSVNARRAQTIDITSTSAGTHAFTFASDSLGINITASLEATNYASAGVELSDAQQPWPDVLLTAPTQSENLLAGMVRGQDLIRDLRSQFAAQKPQTPPRPSTPAPAQPPAKGLPVQDPVDSGVPMEFAGTFAVSVYEHTVIAHVGPNATLKSGKDINVMAGIEESSNVASISEATRNGLDAADKSNTGEAREDVEISVAFGFVKNKNIARAIIDANATVDARGSLAVESAVEYPFLVETASANFNPAETVKESGLDGFAFLVDGTLGAGTNLFNTSVSALGGDPGSNAADKFVLGLAIGIQLFENESTARIGDGAKINQDPLYRTVNQSVNVHAETTMQMVEVGHIAAFNLSLTGILESGTAAIAEGDFKSALQGIINPFGVSGQNAIGASVLVTVATNNTTAEIASNALVHTGSSGDGLSVLAEQDITSVAVAITGGQASEFGLSPSVTVASFTTKTIASIGSGARVTGGPVKVDAEDTLNRYGIDGGYVLGNKIGVGVAIGVNLLDRKTLAFIGSDSPNSDSVAVGAPPHIDVTGAVTVEAKEKGNVFAFGLAAAVLTDPLSKGTSKQPTTSTSSTVPVAGVTVAVGASVAYNRSISTVKAFIDDPSVRARSVKVHADSSIVVRAIVIGGAVDLRGGSTNIAVGGAFAINDLDDNSVEAFIRDAEIVTTGTGLAGPAVSVQATNNSTIYADGGGVALVVAKGATSSVTNISVGISVALNDIDTDVLAFVDHSPIDATGDVAVKALLVPTIDALTIGGAGAVSSGGTGSVLNIAGAGAGSKNVIHGKSHAYVIDTNPTTAAGIITRNGGDLIVSASDLSNITADGGAVAVALSLSPTGNYTNLGFAVSVAINEIANDVAAYVKDSSVNSAGHVMLTATSDATIDALTIGGAITSGGSFSGAGSGNTIRNPTTAYIDGGTGVNAGPAVLAIGAVSVTAMDKSKIIADAGGVSVVVNISKSTGGTLSGSFGIGAAVNDIQNIILANILDSSVTGKSVTVDAKSMAEIDVLSIGGAGAVGINQGSAFSFNGAGAGSGNTIKNIVGASINDLDDTNGDTIVRSTNGAITVSAMDSSTIKADAGAVAFSLGIAQGSTNFNLSVGISVAINEVSNTVLAFIDDADVGSAAGVDLRATSTSSIEALTIAGAGAIGLRPSGASGFGLQFSGAGTGSGNKIDGTTQAKIAADATVTSSAGMNVSVMAMDASSINAKAIAGSLSAQLGSGGSISIGAAIAKNTIDSDVLAFIDDAVATSAGSVIVSATSSARVDALTVAVALSLNINAGQGVSIAGSGAGAQSTNTITNTIESSIRGGSVVTTSGVGDVNLKASDDSTIKADSGGGSLAVSASPKGFSGAFGVSAGLSYNTIRNSIRAYIDGQSTRVSSADAIVLLADSKAKVDALAASVAVAIAIANPKSGFGLAMVGAGAESNNTIDNTISAFIGNQTVVGANGDIELDANDNSTIKAEVPAVSVAISIGVGLSTSVTLSNNTISNKIDAYIGASQVSSTNGDISLDAQSNGKVEAFATAISISISIGGSGQGGKAVSQIIGHTQAHVDAGAFVEAHQGDVIITSTSTAFTNAENKGGGGGAISITALLADSTISAPTKAYVEGATINAGGLRISSSALGKDGVTARTAKSKVVPGTVAIVGGGGGKATSTISGAVEAYISKGSTVNINNRIGTIGAIEIAADSTSVADADTPGGSGGGLTVTALLSEAIASGATRAYVDQATLSAFFIDIRSTSNNLANAHLLVANVSLAGGGGGKATAKQLADTEAYATRATLATPFRGVPSSGVNIEARSTSTALAKAEGGGGGVINASAFESLSTIGEVGDSATTSAYLGSGVNLANFPNLKVDADSSNTAKSDLLSVSIGGAGISSAHAKSNVYADTEAYIGLKDFGFPVAITMAPGIGGIDINSRSRTNVLASETAGGGGGLAIGSAFTETNLGGKTTAFIGDFTNIVTRDINVHSEILGATAYANLLAATGGLISIGSTKATVDAKPKAMAYIGKQANVNANNIDILAIGRGEADAQCNSSGGGVLQVGVANAKSIVDPTVDAYIGDGSNVNAGGDVKVNSLLLADIDAPPSDIIMDSPDDADLLAVDVDRDTVDFNIRVRTGDQLIYNAPALAPSFGPTHGRAYNVIVVEPGQKLQFGDEFAGSKVDGDTDRIIFDTPHAFKPGDAVRYDAKGGLSIVEPWQTTLATNNPLYVDPSAVLYVRGIFTDPSNPLSLDLLSIRLARTPAAATASEALLLKPFDAALRVDPSADNITFTGHGFADSQAVTYRGAASATFLTEAVDVNVVDRLALNILGIPTIVKDVQRDVKGVGLHFNNNNVLLPSHTFNTGDAVTYTSDDPIGGLVSGNTYFVIRVDANQIKLAGTYHEAVGLSFDNRGNSDPADDIVAIPVTPLQLNPSSGQSKKHQLSRNLQGLVDGRTYYVKSPTANTFQLAATRDGIAIEIDHSDDVTIVQRNGSVANTIRPVTRGGIHLVGTLGIDLRPGTEAQSLRIDLTGQPTGGNHRLLGGIATLAIGDGKSAADAVGGSGGAIDVGVPTGNLTSVQIITAHIDATNVTAGGNVEIAAKSTSNVSSKADTGGGGIASIGEAHSDTVAASTTSATVGKSTRIQAGRDFVMNSESNHTTNATAKSVGGGPFAVKVAETTSKLTGNTNSKVGEGANVSAGGLLAVRSTSHSIGYSNAETYAVALGAFADSDNTNDDRGVSIISPATVEVGKGAVLEAESVDLNASIGSTIAGATASATAYSPVLIGVVTAYADASVGVLSNASVVIDANPAGSANQTKITGRRGVDIQAHHPNPLDITKYQIGRNAYALAVALIPPQAARQLGVALVTSTVEAKPEALIVAGTRGTGTPLVTRPTVPELALYVDADFATTWNADVEISSGASPELVVDANGNITKQVNVNATVNSAFQTVNVTGLVNSGPGQVLFEGDGAVAGNQGTFSFRRTLDRVDITTHKYKLFVGNLNVVNKDVAGREPKVTIDVPIVTLEFDVTDPFKSTEIKIQNFDPAPDQGIGIRMDGLIDNPIGTTKLTTLAGGIYSANFRQRRGVVRTNRLEINAGTDAGGTAVDETDRIPIDIVESPGRPAHMSVMAGRDINVGIQGLQRGPSATDFVTTTDPTPSLFMAGERADIMLLGGLHQKTVTVPANFGIQVFETSRVTLPSPAPLPTSPPIAPRTTPVTNHFRISTGNSLNLPAGVFGTGNTPIEVTYDLGLIKAGVSIDVYKDDLVSSRVNILSDTDIVPGANNVNIDSRTNGFIDLTEITGDMRIGEVRSTTSDVKLTATTGSIVDVPNNLNQAGDAAADAIGVSLTLNAQNLIGSDPNRFEIDSSAPNVGVVDAMAQSAIFLTEVDDGDAVDDDFFNVGLIKGMDVTLSALRGAIFDAKNDYAADVVGDHIELSANRTIAFGDAIGQLDNDLEIDSSFAATGGLIARANANIRVTETTNELYVLAVSGIDPFSLPDAFITVRDTGSNRNDMLITGQGSPGVFVPGLVNVRDAFLTAGDDFHLPDNAAIVATRSVNIRIDPPASDPDAFGGKLEIDAEILTVNLQLTGGDDFDTFETVLQMLEGGNNVQVFGGQPSYPTYPGDRLIIDTKGNLVSHPPFDQASIEQGRGTLTSAGFSSISFVNIELIDRIPNTPNVPARDEIPIALFPPTFCAKQFPVIFSEANGNRIRVIDYDDLETNRLGAAFFMFTGTAANPIAAGTLSWVDSGLPVRGNGTPTNPLILTGGFATLDAALARGLRYTPLSGFSGPVMMMVRGFDNLFINENIFSIQLGCSTNNPPINILPPPISTTETTVTLSQAGGNKLAVADIDAGNATNFVVNLSVPTGSIALLNPAGVNVLPFGPTLVLIGSLANINSALGAGLQFTAPVGFTGFVPLTINSNDNGNTGTGGPKSDVDVFPITIVDGNNLNDPPVNRLPTPFFTDQVPVLLSQANGNALVVTDIDAGNADDFLVSLSVPTGTLSLDNLFGVTAAGDGSVAKPLTLTGSLANINSALANGLRFRPAYDDFLGIKSITIVSNDRGNSGDGGPMTDTDIFNFQIFDFFPRVNDPPINQLPAPVTTRDVPFLFSAANGNNLYVVDLDAGDANDFFVSLGVATGNLILVNPSGLVAISGNGSAATPLGLRGTLASINQALAAGLLFVPSGPPGTTTLTILSNDSGNTGTGGPKTDTDTLNITVVDGDPQVNDPPVNHVPGPVTTSQLPIVFSQAKNNPLWVTDVDAGNGDIMVTLTALDGRLTLASSTNLTVTGSGTLASPFMLTGSLANINTALLAGVTFIPKGGFTGQTSLVITSNDKGNTGTGGPQQDTDSVVINVVDANDLVNDPPVNHLPPNVTSSQLRIVFAEQNRNMIAVTDVDAGGANNFMVSLSVAHGILTLGSKTGLTISGDGSSSSPLMLTGKLSDIDTALASGLTFLPHNGFTGTTTLTVTSNDKGNTGAGGELTDTDTLTINVFDNNPGVNDPPVNQVPPPIVSDQLPTILSYANNNFLFVTDIDSRTTPNFMVSLSVPIGTLFLVSNSGVSVSGSGTTVSPLMLTGTLDSINTALLAGIQFLPPAGFLGTTKLTILSNDKGIPGVPGSERTDTDMLDITIVDNDPQNNPPINHLPPPVISTQVPLLLSAANNNHLYVTDIDVGNASNFSVSLVLTDGKLKLPNAPGLSVSGNGTAISPLTVTGRLADINAALASGLRVIPYGDFLANKTLLTITSDDHGNTGLGGPGLDIDTLEITILDPNPGVNNPPQNHVITPITTSQIPYVFSEAFGNELFVTDIDAGTANNFMVTLSVDSGSLSVLSSAGLTVSGAGTSASPLMLTGKLDDINNSLAAGLQFLPAGGTIGTSIVTMISNDKGNTGAGGPLSDTDTISITVVDRDPNNNPPVNQTPPSFATEATLVVLSEVNGNKLSVSDVDAGNANNFMVTLSVGNGTLALANSAGLTVAGNGTVASPLMLTGTLADINARLASGLQFTPIAGFLGTTTLSIISNDKGNSGPGGSLIDSDSFDITITSSANDPPINRLPAPFRTNELPVVLSGASGRALSVSDVDAGNANNFMVSLSGDVGTLSLDSQAGLTVSGNGQVATPLMLTGRLSDINAVLNTGLRFRPPGGFVGVATLTIASNDKGNTGSGGPLTDTDSFQITIVDFDPLNNNPPMNHLPPPVATSQAPVVFSEANGNQLYVTDIDAGSAANFMVTLSVGNGMLVLSKPTGLSLSGDGTLLNPLMLTGTLANIDAALAAGLQFLPNGFQGTTTLTIVSDDKGNTGLGGGKTDTDSLNINIFDNNPNNNDPPVNRLPAPIVTSQLPVVLSQATGNPLFVTDIDAGNANNFMVQLHVGFDGTLSLPNGSGLSVSGDGSVFRPLLLTGSLDTINRRLVEGLVYVPTAGFQGTTSLSILSNDNGNTGAGGSKTDLDLLSISIVDGSPANDPPVNVLPRPITFGQFPAVLSRDNFNALAVTDIDAGFANDFMVSLSVADGRLSLIDKLGITVSGNGRPGSPLMLTGALADINNRLATGLQFIPGALGSTLLTIFSDDKGNTGTGGPKTDTDTLVLNIVDNNPIFNDPPINFVPSDFTTSQLPVVLSETNGNELSVADIDAGNAVDFLVKLSVPTGELRLLDLTGLMVSGSGTNALMLKGSLVDINTALAAGLQFLPPAPFVGTTILTIESNDNGNTGIGGPKSATNSFSIRIVDLDPANNDAPINHLPPAVVSNQLPTVLSHANGNKLFVTDIDAGTANNFMVTLSVPIGRLSLFSHSGLTVSGNGTPTTPLMLTGTLANINAALATGLRFLPPGGFLGKTQLTIVSNDKGNTGAGGEKSDTDTLDIEIADLNPTNDAPINHLPPPITANQIPVVLSSANNNELFVTDIDAGTAADFMVTLTVANGLLTLSSTSGLTVAGNGTVGSPLMLTGTLANINAALANGLQYNPSGFLGTTTLTILSNDKGNTGPGGPLTDTDTLSLTVVDANPANDPPVNRLPPPIITSNPQVVLSQANGNSLFVTDIDAGNANNFMVTLTVANGTLSLASSVGLTVSGNGSVATPLMLTGTLFNINTALGSGLLVTPPSGFSGATTLTIISNDRGNSGPGGPLTDTDTLNIRILDSTLPRVVSVVADSSTWTTAFRDFVDGTFIDSSAVGYRVPKGLQQHLTVPWVNVDRLKVTFSEDVGSSLTIADFQLTAAPGFLALGVPPGTPPTIVGVTYDAATLTATLMLSKVFPASVVDLKILASGVTDSQSNLLDGEWINAVSLGNSGNSVAGGDFNFRIFLLPGDSQDLSAQTVTRNVNATDGQRVRDLQNGLALPGVGVFGYDPRADLDGNNRINSDDGTLVRNQQNAIIVRQSARALTNGSGLRQNSKNHWDVDDDGIVAPIDALLIINALNGQYRDSADEQARTYFDVSGDGVLAAFDVLLVVNFLNSNSQTSPSGNQLHQSAHAEGEIFARELDFDSFEIIKSPDAQLMVAELRAERRDSGQTISVQAREEQFYEPEHGALTPLSRLLSESWLNRESRRDIFNWPENVLLDEFESTIDEVASDVARCRTKN